MAETAIEWTDKVWNPVTGCSKVSQGCTHCYAERVFPRAYGTARKFTDVVCHQDRLAQPLAWRKPCRIFVNSMGDLFHDDVPFDFIDRVFAMMACSPRHTFQILTKRPQRMRDYLIPSIGKVAGSARAGEIGLALDGMVGVARSHAIWDGRAWPLPNVWLGVSVEEPKELARLDILRQIPAALRMASFEPLLGDLGRVNLDGIDWAICGGESGRKARPMHPDWARSLRDQCQAAGVPFFFKQWGEFTSEQCPGVEVRLSDLHPGQCVTSGIKGHHTLYTRVGKRAAGRQLDGREWSEYPNVIS